VQDDTIVLSLTAAEQRFRFVDVPEPPVPSLLRDFSAPVRLKGQPIDRLKFLFARDTDPFGRWEAGQQLATHLLLDMVAAHQRGETPILDADFIDAYARTLADHQLDKALIAEALTLPGEEYLADQMATVDVEAIHAARQAARITLAGALREPLLRAYHDNSDAGPYSIDPSAMARRALKNLCLATLATWQEDDAILALVTAQFRHGGNMTDELTALSILSDIDRPERTEALDAFYERWQTEALVIDKWFSIQAMSHLPDTVETVRALTGHPAFTLKVPNRARAVIGAFAAGNQLRFHRADGAGYAFLADQVLAIDPMNPQLAARLLGPLGRWRRQDPARQGLMKAQLQRILDTKGLSKDTYEIASKSLG
jgi:aminopeptidase N